MRPLSPGDVVAERFELELAVSAGGMGTIWRARDRHGGQRVALKISLHASGRGLDRFEREAHMLADLSHPHVVRYVAHAGRGAELPYLAMEWLEGEDLSAHLARRKPALAETLALARRIADALACAHARGIVHRDVKPENVFLVDRDLDRPKLLDFGIARAGVRSSLTRPGVLLGTPWYMAPEQARGAAEVDARADVFSLGCVLYECLTGRTPFTGDHLAAILAKLVLEEPPRIRELASDVPPSVEALVMRMMAKDPNERPADGRALAAELGALSLDTAEETRPHALTAGELRLVSVVLAVPSGSIGPADATRDAASIEIDALDRAGHAVSALDARLVPLLDGSLVALFARSGTARDEAARAARYALALRGVLPECRLALATGSMPLGARVPLGEVIDRAAHLALGEGPAAIRIDEVTAGLLDARFEVRGDDRGLFLAAEHEPIEQARTLLGKETPCVGREGPLSILAAAVRECVEDSVARAALIAGASGIGKSRVLAELLRRIRERDEDIEIWTGRGDELSAGSPLGVLAQALRRAFGLHDDEPLEVRRQKLRARVARHVRTSDLSRVSEFLGELVGTPFGDEDSVELRTARSDATLLGDQMRRAWEDLLEAELAAQPLVLVFEDLQWSDRATVQYVDAALRRFADRPLMVLAVARREVSELFPNLWAERGLQTLLLAPLAARGAERLVRHALGDTDAATVARIVEHADGNPFFLEELIRAVAEGRGDRLPETVLAMVQARLDALPDEARRVLRAASVFGQTFGAARVAALLASHASLVSEWLAYLSERELVVRQPEVRALEELEYAFRHVLVREAAYATLTDDDRTLGHRLAADWLIDSGEPDAVVLAEHCERGGDDRRAAGFWKRAAEDALRGNDFEGAIARAARAREPALSGELSAIQAEAYRWRGALAEAEQCGLDAMAGVPPGSPIWHHAAAEVATAAGRRGNRDRLVVVGDALLSNATDTERSPDEPMAAARSAYFLFTVGERELAERLLSRAGERASELVPPSPAVFAWLHRARAIAAMIAGDASECLRHFSASAEHFESAGDLRNACMQLQNVGYAYVELGAFDRAETALRRALATSERLGLPDVSAAARHNLGIALASLGQLEAARREESAAVAIAQRAGDPRFEAGSRGYLASFALLAGELDEAEAQARAALELSESLPPLRAFAFAMLAAVSLARGEPVPALASAKDAMALLERLGGIDHGEALVRSTYAEALYASGDHEAALAAIADARARLEERARRISDEELRRSFVDRVPENARTFALAEAWSQGQLPRGSTT